VDAVREIGGEIAPEPGREAPAPTARVLGVPARSDADEAALTLLGRLLAAGGVALEVTSPDLLSAEVVGAASERSARVVVVGALPPGGLVQARYLVKRLRAAVPDVKIVVGRWGVREDVEAARETLTAAGADAAGASLLETRDLVVALARLDTTQRAA
jgi:hypothetical protein